ncbi:hypothetical protein KIPB_013199, partial [Kipferlia bialata]|eukprot:g13199.t1
MSGKADGKEEGGKCLQALTVVVMALFGAVLAAVLGKVLVGVSEMESPPEALPFPIKTAPPTGSTAATERLIARNP